MTAVILNMNNSDVDGEIHGEGSAGKTTPHKRCLRCGNRILTGKEDCCRRCAGPSADEIYDKGMVYSRGSGIPDAEQDQCGNCKGTGKISGKTCPYCHGSPY